VEFIVCIGAEKISIKIKPCRDAGLLLFYSIATFLLKKSLNFFLVAILAFLIGQYLRRPYIFRILQ
jgi:hypothetical protein